MPGEVKLKTFPNSRRGHKKSQKLALPSPDSLLTLRAVQGGGASPHPRTSHTSSGNDPA